MQEKGQTLLIVVLMMVVALTVGLSVASRSITNLRTTTEEENSQRAFSAAEAGIERALQNSSTPANLNLGNNSMIKSVSITPLSGTDFLFNGGTAIDRDYGIDIWLIPHDDDDRPDYTRPWNGNLTIYWGDSSIQDCNNAAIEVIVISGTKALPRSKRYGFDKCQARRQGNNFDPGASGSGGFFAGKNFAFKTTPINISSGLIARVIPIYAASPIGVSGGITSLPSQGKRIESIGVSGSANRKITFFKGYPTIPSEFFQYALFSPIVSTP